MIIGTDIDLETCQEEGYMVMVYDARKKFGLDVPVALKRTMPGTYSEEDKDYEYTTHIEAITAREVWGKYEEHKTEIQSFAETPFESITDIKEYYDLLHLADDVDSYMNL